MDLPEHLEGLLVLRVDVEHLGQAELGPLGVLELLEPDLGSREVQIRSLPLVGDLLSAIFVELDQLLPSLVVDVDLFQCFEGGNVGGNRFENAQIVTNLFFHDRSPEFGVRLTRGGRRTLLWWRAARH